MLDSSYIGKVVTFEPSIIRSVLPFEYVGIEWPAGPSSFGAGAIIRIWDSNGVEDPDRRIRVESGSQLHIDNDRNLYVNSLVGPLVWPVGAEGFETSELNIPTTSRYRWLFPEQEDAYYYMTFFRQYEPGPGEVLVTCTIRDQNSDLIERGFIFGINGLGAFSPKDPIPLVATTDLRAVYAANDSIQNSREVSFDVEDNGQISRIGNVSGTPLYPITNPSYRVEEVGADPVTITGYQGNNGIIRTYREGDAVNPLASIFIGTGLHFSGSLYAVGGETIVRPISINITGVVIGFEDTRRTREIVLNDAGAKVLQTTDPQRRVTLYTEQVIRIPTEAETPRLAFEGEQYELVSIRAISKFGSVVELATPKPIPEE